MIANGNSNRLTRPRRSSKAIKRIACEEIDDCVGVLNGTPWIVGSPPRSIDQRKKMEKQQLIKCLPRAIDLLSLGFE